MRLNRTLIALAAVAAWVVSLGLDFLINNIWLARLYAANSWAYRHAEQMTPLLPLGFGVQFIGCVAFSYAYARGYKGNFIGTAEGVFFGLVVACMVDGFAVVALLRRLRTSPLVKLGESQQQELQQDLQRVQQTCFGSRSQMSEADLRSLVDKWLQAAC